MKRSMLALCTLFFVLAVPVVAQDPSAQTRAMLEQLDALERVKRLNATVETLLETQAALQKRISALSEEVVSLRAELSREQSRSVSRSEMTALVDKLQEIDQKRESDKKLILDSLDQIRRLAKSAPAAEVVRPPTASTYSGPKYEYEVAPGNYLVDIIKAYNEEYKRQGKGTITVEDVVRANPGLNPDRLKVGQKLIIPEP